MLTTVMRLFTDTAGNIPFLPSGINVPHIRTLNNRNVSVTVVAAQSKLLVSAGLVSLLGWEVAALSLCLHMVCAELC